MTVDPDKCYRAVEDVVTRQIEDQLVIVPLADGIGDLDSEMFSLNRTGVAVWEHLDGKTSLINIIHGIAKKFNAPYDTIHTDVVELVEILLKKGLVIEASY